MHPHLTTYFEALMALTRTSDAPRAARRKRSPQGVLFADLQPVDEPELARPRDGLSTVERVEHAERSDAVRKSRTFRLINQPDPRLGWLLRFAVGCAFGNACDPAMPRAFPLRAATRALGDQLGAPITLVTGLEPLLDRGLLMRTEDGGLSLLPGMEPWLLGTNVSDAELTRVPEDPLVAALPEIRGAASRLAALLEAGKPVVLRCSEPEVAVALARCISTGRGRGLQAWAHSGSSDPLPVLCSTAQACGEDLLLVLGPEEHNPFLGQRRRFLRLDGFQGALLFVVVDPAACEGDPLLDLDPVIDLGPLCKAVAASLGRGAGAGAPTGATTNRALRIARARAVHQALYPGIPLDEMAPIAEPDLYTGDGRPDRDPPDHLADERWEVPTSTLDSLILPASVRSTLDALARSAQDGGRAVILLHGPPGTGKSLAASCLAGSIGRPLYRMQGSSLRGRFYGEFEGRLAAVFAEAQKRRAVLLIDEADEWVGRRQGSAAQVGGAHVLESSQMLQAIEHYEGVAVLTTNRSETLDPALSRRVDAWIHLQLPAMEERMALWVLALGEAPPLRPVDLMLLAAIPLSGGEIQASVREVTVTGGDLTPVALLAAARRRSERRALTGE